MARLYADENVPVPVVGELRELGHDVLTAVEDGNGNRRYPDAGVYATASQTTNLPAAEHHDQARETLVGILPMRTLVGGVSAQLLGCVLYRRRDACVGFSLLEVLEFDQIVPPQVRVRREERFQADVRVPLPKLRFRAEREEIREAQAGRVEPLQGSPGDVG